MGSLPPCMISNFVGLARNETQQGGYTNRVVTLWSIQPARVPLDALENSRVRKSFAMAYLEKGDKHD